MAENKKPATAATVTGTWNKRGLKRRISMPKIITLIALVVTMFVACSPGPATEWQENTFVVRPGQTLWEIAEACKDMGDVRALDAIVIDIKNHNNLGDFIRPGDKLKVWTQVLKNGGSHEK